MESILLTVVILFPAFTAAVAAAVVIAAGEEAGWGAAIGVSKLASRWCSVPGVVVVADQLMSPRHLRCQGSYFGNTEEQRLCESHLSGRGGTGHAGVGLCWLFFLVAYTRTPGDLHVRNYGRKNHCNGTPVFDGPTAHRCGKLHICYRCPSPSAAVVGVAPFAASFYLSS